jgi:beta-galactosidase
MGNGPGNIKEYIDAFYKYPTLQGGFAWEWANHGLVTKDKKTKEEFMAYGGDFGEEVHDSTFVMDGLVNSDHTPNAGLTEFKKAIEPVQLLESSETQAKFINRYDFITLDHLVCRYSVTYEAEGEGESGVLDIPSGVAAGQTFDFNLPKISQATGDVLLNISFGLKESTPYLDKGFEVATAQIPMATSTAVQRPTSSNGQLDVTSSRNTLKITSGKSTWQFNTLHGTLTSWLQNSTELITKAPELDVFRAPTDNDIPQDGWDWKDKSLHLAKLSTRKVDWSSPSQDTLTVVVHQRLAPATLSWSVESVVTYTFCMDGSLSIKVTGEPKGENLPRTLPRIGLVMELPTQFQKVEWFGRGPGESYRDSKLSQRIGKHTASSIDALWVDYEVPQESSNRTDTRWVALSHDAKDVTLLAQFVQGEERKSFDFQVSHYRMRDVAEAGHPYELRRKKREEVVLRLDAEHHGLGSGSCGPRTLDEYSLLAKKFEFEVLLLAK